MKDILINEIKEKVESGEYIIDYTDESIYTNQGSIAYPIVYYTDDTSDQPFDKIQEFSGYFMIDGEIVNQWDADLED